MDFYGHDAAYIKKQRCLLRLNQQQYWSRVGVGQSNGSRYENGRTIPMPVRLMLNLTYGFGLDGVVNEPAALNKEDHDIVQYLRKNHPDLVDKLTRIVKNRKAVQVVITTEA